MTDAFRGDETCSRAYRVTVPHLGADAGIYWAQSASGARARAWRHFSDVFDARCYTFRHFMVDAKVRRAAEFDGMFRGRHGLLPEFAAAPSTPNSIRSEDR